MHTGIHIGNNVQKQSNALALHLAATLRMAVVRGQNAVAKEIVRNLNQLFSVTGTTVSNVNISSPPSDEA